MAPQKKLIPIYTTRGYLGAFLSPPYLYNPEGEWIGFVSADSKVFSVYGHYVGYMDEHGRVLRKREASPNQERSQPPPEPPSILPPAHVPLPPQMPEIPIGIIDVFDDAPELLPSLDHGDLKEDLD